MPTHVVTAKPSPLGGKLGVDVTKAYSSAAFKLGSEVKCEDGNTYIFVQANGAIDAFAACAISESHEVAELTTTTSGVVPTVVVVPQLALADDEYGFAVKSGGAFSVLAAANCAADVKIYTTSTAGVVDDSSSSTDLIQGLRLNAANGGTQAAVSASAEGGMKTNAQD